MRICKWWDNIKIDLKVILCESGLWIKLSIGFLRISRGKFGFYKRRGICSLIGRLSAPQQTVAAVHGFRQSCLVCKSISELSFRFLFN